MASSRSIIWSPHGDRTHFLVSGTELSLFKWIAETPNEPGKAQFISNVPKIALVMCADWCADPHQPDLIAVGLTTGKTLLVRMQDHINALDESPQQSPLYYRPTTTATTIPSATKSSAAKQYPVLGVKMSRPCNVVSFSSTHPQLLAAGLDKVRNDPCLLVWDISQAVDTPVGPQSPSTFSYYQNYRPQNTRSATAYDRETLFSDRARLTTSQYAPYADHPVPTPITGGGAGGNISREQRPIQQYGPSEAIASCAWSSQVGAPLLVAGMGNKYLRVYDIRVDSMATPLQFATKAVYGTTVDPFNPYRLASYTEEGVIKLWDLRKNTDPILSLNGDSNSKHSLSRITFSPSRPGLLASLSRDAISINLWDIQETSSLKASMTTGASGPQALEPTYRDDSYKIGKSTLPSLTEIPEDELSIPVLWKSRRSTTSTKPIVCFNFIPKHANNCPSSMSVLVMQKDNQFEAIHLAEACKMVWRPTGGLMLTGVSGMQAYGADVKSKKTIGRKQKLESQFHAIKVSEKEEHWHLPGSAADGDRKDDDKDLEIQTPSLPEKAANELANDISVMMLERVKMGYSMDCRRNLSIIKDDWKMKELWSWIERADILSRDIAQRIDYNFQGVYSLWTGTADLSKKSTNDNMLLLPERAEDMLAMVETAKPNQRNLALKVCGFGFTQSELEDELVRLEGRGEYDKAAGWAFFGGLPHRAIQALGSERGSGENDQQRKLLSAVLAGFQPNASTENQTWRALCESLSRDMVDRPYLRVIFAYISSNDWFRVLNEPNLSLKERVAVALRVLGDQQLTEYLNHLTAQLINEGDVEGVLLTGLTPEAVDLFEQMVNRYGDVQTASLVMNFVVPRRFKDKRVEDWTESYRMLLDRWQLWHSRARFDIQRGQRMSNSGEVAPPQVYVRCTYCSQTLGHRLVAQNVRNREGKRMNVQTNISSGGRGTGKQKPTVCPSCRKPLPRCALCLMHMGTPIDPLRKAIAANDSHQADPAGFDLWFTWCQTCRHGGHAMHIFDWFRNHASCPVSSCECNCYKLSSGGKTAAVQRTDGTLEALHH